KELGKGIPTISYNLRKSGAALIDRKDREQAANELKNFAQYLNNTNRSGVLFAEGTRSRDNSMKPFKPGGLKILIENLQGAYIVPMSISDSWKLQRYKNFPLPLGVHITLKTHQAIKLTDQPLESLIEELENIVRDGIS